MSSTSKKAGKLAPAEALTVPPFGFSVATISTVPAENVRVVETLA
jgi:hypothetical protein